MARINPVVHFEMPYKDSDRMIKFYSQVFGWQANKLGPEMGNYVVVMTGETDDKTQMPTEPGRINGGLFESSKDNQYPSLTIAVDDIREAMKKAEQAGAKVLGGSFKPGEPDDIPGVGLYCGFIDPEGNRVSMLEPKGM
jgi:uncharacterized protein